MMIYTGKGIQNKFDMPYYGYNEPIFDESVQYEPDTYSPSHTKEALYHPDPSFKESYDPYYLESHKSYSAKTLIKMYLLK